MLITVEETQFNLRRCFGDPLEDRTISHTVTAPRAGDTEQMHLPGETAEQVPLLIRELDAFVDGLPALAMCVGAVPGEELVIG